jgi:uncharacterized protein (TIGR03067 family)
MRGMPVEHANPEAGEAGLRALDGWWIARHAILGGIALPAELVPELSLLIFNGGFFFGKDEGLLTVDAAAEPAAMDIRIIRGPNRLRFVPAVFALTGDTLRVCYDLAGRERPTDFSAPCGTRRLLVTYQRMADPNMAHASAVAGQPPRRQSSAPRTFRA